jgi:uncharacterized protein (DUF2062 family)
MIPSREALRRSRSLQWLGPLLERPWLWRMNRRGVALGAALGVFFGLLIPIAQIAFAAAFAVVLRANLPVAAAATLVSNPLTYAPIYVAAYRVGASLLGEPASEATAAAIEEKVEIAEPLDRGWWQRFSGVAKPIALGAAVLAAAGAAIAYVLALLAWRMWLLARLRRRRRRAS